MMWESIQTDSKLTMTKSLQDFGIGLHCSSLGKIEWPVLGLLQNTRPHYPHSRTFFCQCELMQSLSKSCLEMLHDVMDLLHIVNDTYLFDPSLFLTGVSACT